MIGLGKNKKTDDIVKQAFQSVSAQGDKGPYIPALSMDDASKRYSVNTTAEKVHRRDFLIRLVAIILLVLLVVLGISYCSMEILNKAGRFTVSLMPNEYGISLSDTPDFSNPTLNLYADPIEEMDNITKKWIQNLNGELGDDPVYEDFNDIDKVWGQHNGKNYIAYTFGVKNASADKEDVVTYKAALNTNYTYKGADEAIRVAVFKNGVPTLYAKPKKGTTDTLEDFEADKNFVSDSVVMEEIRPDFKVGEMDRYTVVIWLEGEDPECVNDIMGGEAKFSMDFTVIGGKSDKEAG